MVGRWFLLSAEPLPENEAERYQHMTPAEWVEWYWAQGQISAYAERENTRRAYISSMLALRLAISGNKHETVPEHL
jgi:hypothetical protein